MELWASDCSKAAVQLIRSGLFPSSPIYPTLAVEIRLLDFVQQLFLRIAPNHTAWCSAAIDFLAAQGYHLAGDDPLRRCFSNSLHWFMTLNDMSLAHMNTVVQHAREELVPQSSTTPFRLSPQAHCGDTRFTSPGEEQNSSRPGVGTGGEGMKEIDSRSRKRGRDSDDERDQSMSSPDRRNSQEEESEDHGEDEQHRDRDTGLSRPTEYLCSRCPACFGGKW